MHKNFVVLAFFILQTSQLFASQAQITSASGMDQGSATNSSAPMLEEVNQVEGKFGSAVSPQRQKVDLQDPIFKLAFDLETVKKTRVRTIQKRVTCEGKNQNASDGLKTAESELRICRRICTWGSLLVVSCVSVYLMYAYHPEKNGWWFSR